MSSLRPKKSDLHLERHRLLQSLPDDPGYVVHLEAPYGYGKSILAAQYAESLETEGWSIKWANATQDLRSSVATALALNQDAPWQLILSTLGQEETLLVIENLEGDVDLTPLLSNLQGILLLSSRSPLQHPELLKYQTHNRFIHLDASALAFTLQESEQLIPGEAKARDLWEQTGGWSLPLHFAALTGQAPDTQSLLDGIRVSLEHETWQELLFLAALELLPSASFTENTKALIRKGFVQALESGVHLHPYISEIVNEHHQASIATIVEKEASRLPLLLQGRAFAHCQLEQALESILENTEAELWREDPKQLVNWDASLNSSADYRRHWSIGASHARLGDIDNAVERFEKALAETNLAANAFIGIVRDYCMPIGFHNRDRGLELIEQAKPYLGQVDSVLAGRFLANSAFIHLYAGDFQMAIEAVDQALDTYPANSEYRLGALINKALFEWDAYGNFEGRLSTQLQTLEQVEALYPVQAAGQYRDLGIFHLWLRDEKQARFYLEKARAAERINPSIGLEAKATIAYLDKDLETVTQCAQDSKAFSSSYVLDMISMYKIRLEHNSNQSKLAKQSYELSGQGAFSRSSYALALLEKGSPEEALSILDEHYDQYSRAMKPYVLASRYLISREQTDLEQFLDVCTARERILAGFIPIDALPNQAALSKYYPIREVLNSNWKEAIVYRQSDIPDLEIQLFGKLEVKLLNESLELTDRQKQIIVLFVMGKSRDEIAETMWPETDTKKQRNNLNVQLNFLRKIIEPWGVTTYLFEDGLKRVSSDYQDLLDALEHQNEELVFSLYKEPLAPGVHLDTVITEREQLKESVVDCLYSSCEDLKDPHANSYLIRILELDPLNEEALQLLLQNLVQAGRKREAKRRYNSFARQLHEEMELEPLDETKALLEA